MSYGTHMYTTVSYMQGGWLYTRTILPRRVSVSYDTHVYIWCSMRCVFLQGGVPVHHGKA